MDASTGEEPPPDSTDVAGWREAIADRRFRRFPLEAIAAAIQDLRPNRDGGLISTLVKHLSDSVYRIVRSQVGYNHPNRGEDIVERVCDQFWVALFQPQSADGKGIRQALVSRLTFRVKDAIAKEARERRIPDEAVLQPRKKPKKSDTPEDEGREVEFVDIEEQLDLAEEPGSSDGDDAPPSKARWNTALLDGVRAADEQIDVDRFLKQNIKDDQKRLAFRLFMDGLPFKSKKYDSIANALGIDERTARLWIEEIQKQLKEKIGDPT
jgi:DNA-directed RNA polymerase specialized sigma24 family protein